MRLRSRIGRAAALAAMLSLVPAAAAHAASGIAYRVYTVRPGDTLSRIAARSGVPVAAIAALNHLRDPDRLAVGQELWLPLDGAAGTAAGVAGLQAASWTRVIAPVFLWPLRGVISSAFGPRWGRMHEGVDIAAPLGTTIRAAAPGVVERAGWEPGYGRVVVLRHSFGLETVYAHASRILVGPGEAVAAGQPLALVGQSGDATGPHLHFEVRIAGTPKDPLPLLRAGGPGGSRGNAQPVTFTVGR